MNKFSDLLFRERATSGDRSLRVGQTDVAVAWESRLAAGHSPVSEGGGS
jgi:hypothetical protein